MQELHGTDSLRRRAELAQLADFYGGLLTEKQREALRLHCEEDMSLAEIAGEMGISRQGVHELLTRAGSRLNELEDALGMARRFGRMLPALEECAGLLRGGAVAEAAAMLERLIAEERDAAAPLGGE